MANFNRRLLLLAFPALAACSTMPGAPTPAATDIYAGKSVLDAAIEAAGGEAALRQVKELGWTGTAVVTAEGKTTELEMETAVRPFSYGRSTSWPKAEGVKAARTMQVDFGKAWTITGSSWSPMTEAQATHETQQFALYGVMLLAPLKDAGAKVEETAPGQDGTRNLHVEYPNAPPMDLRFDKSGRLIRVADSVRDPKGGAALIPQVAEFTGEMTSNGVKWPKKISIRQNDAPYFDLELATFEARPAHSTIPLKQSIDTDDRAPNEGAGDAG